MTQRRGGLGRGLGALIPTGPPGEITPAPLRDGSGGAENGLGGGERRGVSRETTDGLVRRPPFGNEPDWAGGARLYELEPDLISPNPRQPRRVFEEGAIAELVVSIREVGMLQPVVVRPDPSRPGRYELVMGERRWRASQLAGLELIPAIVRDTPDDALLRDALLENLHRAELNPLEEAAAYQQLLEEFGTTHDELALRIGRSRSQVTNTIRLLGLPPSVQRRVAAGVLSAGHARALLGLPDSTLADALATRIVAEGLSVRSVEELVSLAKSADAPAASPRATVSRRDPAADALAARVADRLDTRAHVELGRAKSRLVIDVADLADLARVVDLITQPIDTPGG